MRAPMQHVNIRISGDDTALTPPAKQSAAVEKRVALELSHQMLHRHDTAKGVRKNGGAGKDA